MATGDLKQGTHLDGGVLGQGQCAASAAKLAMTINGSSVTDVPAATWVVLKAVVFTNSDTTGRVVSYGVLKASGSVGGAGTLQGITVPLGAAGTVTHVLDADELRGALLGPGDSVVAFSDSASKVNYTISGAVSR